MGRFYIRVFRDGVRERTWGCGSRSDNNKHLHDIENGLLSAAKRYQKCQKDHIKYYGTQLGKSYRFELIKKNRRDEKLLYREVECELYIRSNGVSLIKSKDITHVTDDWDPRVLELPPSWW